MSRSRYRIYETNYSYFVTQTVVAWLPVFSHSFAVEIILDSGRHLQNEDRIDLFGFVIMENHLHWIAAHDSLSDVLKRFKSFTARRILDELDRRGFQTLLQEFGHFKLKHKTDQQRQLWQEGSHPQQIQNDEMMWQKLEYIHLNPVRRGYVDRPEDWRYSSARNYAGRTGLIDVVTNWR